MKWRNVFYVVKLVFLEKISNLFRNTGNNIGQSIIQHMCQLCQLLDTRMLERLHF
ncbi:hypothetical protein Hanom_Chr15g01408721 [Helianthus anomalus]